MLSRSPLDHSHAHCTLAAHARSLFRFRLGRSLSKMVVVVAPWPVTQAPVDELLGPQCEALELPTNVWEVIACELDTLRDVWRVTGVCK